MQILAVAAILSNEKYRRIALRDAQRCLAEIQANNPVTV